MRSSLPPVPVPDYRTVRPWCAGGDGERARGQGIFYYACDWLNTACGEGVALIIAVAAGIWAALSLAAGGVCSAWQGGGPGLRASAPDTSPGLEPVPLPKVGGAGAVGVGCRDGSPLPRT